MMNLVTIPYKWSVSSEIVPCRRLIAYEIIHSSLQLETLSNTNLYRSFLPTLNANQRSSSFEVTLMTVPFGSTSSYPAMWSIVRPY
jgi:hypothetical protein